MIKAVCENKYEEVKQILNENDGLMPFENYSGFDVLTNISLNFREYAIDKWNPILYALYYEHIECLRQMAPKCNFNIALASYFFEEVPMQTEPSHA